MNLWWLKLDLPLSSGIVKAMELTSVEASATDDADAIINMSKAKLVKKFIQRYIISVMATAAVNSNSRVPVKPMVITDNKIKKYKVTIMPLHVTRKAKEHLRRPNEYEAVFKG
ncbi:hypothetical protein TNIN_74671 [Trichonephila inaurata madagascariensis]|uniref:Uncharacterized protein n=1 Tax=Trichonephila inaurata madagascariensis TaxID=2747483 RepID=A0A8X6YAD2_9ARAC|nr:hypothetical protein TNIN_74671 [Trichonephila inaurata madagascariensis]